MVNVIYHPMRKLMTDKLQDWLSLKYTSTIIRLTYKLLLNFEKKA